MLVVAGFLVLVIALTVLGSAARERPTFSATMPIVGGGMLLLLVLGLVVLVAGRGSSTRENNPAPRPATPSERQSATPAQGTRLPNRTRPVDLLINPRFDLEGFGSTAPALGDLPDASTKLVEVAVHRSVLLQECEVSDDAVPAACAAGVPAGAVGRYAIGLVELHRVLHLPSHEVDCQVRRCALIATFTDTPKVAGFAALVFGRPVDVPSLRIDPMRDVRRGQLIDVDVQALQPNERATVAWCVPPGPVERDACGRPAPAVAVQADSSGSAHGQLRVPSGDFGPGGQRCDPRSRCAVAVLGSTIAAHAVEVTFAGISGPDLPARRLIGGLVGAAVLAMVALWLTRRRAGTAEDDPFWGVSLDVPEWEGIDLTVEL